MSEISSTETTTEQEQEVELLVEQFRQYADFLENVTAVKDEGALSKFENDLHENNESFALTSIYDENVPRVLVLGETRVGKSSLCNKMAGVYYERYLSEDKEEYIVQVRDGAKEIFHTSDSNYSDTCVTSWSKVNFLDNEKQPFIIIDTPGFNDKDEKKFEMSLFDLKMKLIQIRYIHVVLILLGKNALGGGGGFNDSTLKVVEHVLDMFSHNRDIANHIVVGFTNCDESDEKSWKQSIKKKEKEWKEYLSKTLFNLQNNHNINNNNNNNNNDKNNDKNNNNNENKNDNNSNNESEKMNSNNSNNSDSNINSNSHNKNNGTDNNDNNNININNNNNNNSNKNSIDPYNVPFFKLSSIQEQGDKKWSCEQEFEKLWQCIESKKKISTFQESLMSKIYTIVQQYKKDGLSDKEIGERIRKDIRKEKQQLINDRARTFEYLKFVPRNPVTGVLFGCAAIVSGTLVAVSAPFVGAYAGAKYAISNESNSFKKILKGAGGGFGGFLGGVAVLPSGIVASALYGAAQPFVGAYALIKKNSLEDEAHNYHNDKLQNVAMNVLNSLIKQQNDK